MSNHRQRQHRSDYAAPPLPALERFSSGSNHGGDQAPETPRCHDHSSLGYSREDDARSFIKRVQPSTAAKPYGTRRSSDSLLVDKSAHCGDTLNTTHSSGRSGIQMSHPPLREARDGSDRRGDIMSCSTSRRDYSMDVSRGSTISTRDHILDASNRSRRDRIMDVSRGSTMSASTRGMDYSRRDHVLDASRGSRTRREMDRSYSRRVMDVSRRHNSTHDFTPAPPPRQKTREHEGFVVEANAHRRQRRQRPTYYDHGPHGGPRDYYYESYYTPEPFKERGGAYDSRLPSGARNDLDRPSSHRRTSFGEPRAGPPRYAAGYGREPMTRQRQEPSYEIDYQYHHGRRRHTRCVTPPPARPQKDHNDSQLEEESNEPFLVEIEPGTQVPLRRVEETLEAVATQKVRPVTCLGCSTDLFCIEDCQWYVCPDCRVINSATTNSFYTKKEQTRPTPPQGRYGLGLGFTRATLAQMQGSAASSA